MSSFACHSHTALGSYATLTFVRSKNLLHETKRLLKIKLSEKGTL